MSPRATAAWSAAALVVVLAANQPVYRALVLLIAANLLLTHRRSGTSLRALTITAAAGGATSVVLNVLLAHAGATEFARLPAWLPGLGGPLTLESLVYGAAAGLGLAAALFAVAPMSLLHDPETVAAALPRGLERTGTALAASLAAVGSLGRTFSSVRDAQRMRGWRPRGPRSLSALLVPVALTAVEDAVGLAEAMAARGFGIGPRTRLAPPGTGARGVVVAVAALSGAAVFLAARAAGAAPDWYPYPTLSVPAVSLPALAAVAALAVPLATWPSRPSSA